MTNSVWIKSHRYSGNKYITPTSPCKSSPSKKCYRESVKDFPLHTDDALSVAVHEPNIENNVLYVFLLLVFPQVALRSVCMMCITSFSHVNVFHTGVNVETKLQPAYWNSLAVFPILPELNPYFAINKMALITTLHLACM